MQPTVVTILSTNFAGSHFLSLLLGSHSKSMHLGEIRRLGDGMRSRMQACWHCDPPELCPIVRNVRAREIRSIYRTVYANLVEDGLEKRAFIDTSKRVSWAKRFIGNEDFRFKYIYLIRDPRALVRRWLIGDNSIRRFCRRRCKAVFRGHSFRPLFTFAPQWKICAYKWLDENVEIANFLDSHRLDHQVVTYYDLASDTTSEVMRLMRWIGLDFEPGQLEYWRVQQHGDEKPEYEWVKQQQKQGHIDLRWKDFLSTDICNAIMSQPPIVALLDRLSLVAEPCGLSRRRAKTAACEILPFPRHAQRAAIGDQAIDSASKAGEHKASGAPAAKAA
jgi:hypothetical protein